MTSRETPLAGSRLNTVVKVGDEVRRVAGPWTPTVHALLRHIRHRGFSLAPEPRRADPVGREALRYIPVSYTHLTLPTILRV